MEPYPPFLDLNSALNCHPEAQPAWLDASMPESDALDFSAQLFVVKSTKAAKKTSGQRSSSAAILDASTDKLDFSSSNGQPTVYQCVCGSQSTYMKNYLRHLRTPCRMHELCTRILELGFVLRSNGQMLNSTDVGQHLLTLLTPYLPDKT
jgi:hypothetical protein